MVKIFVGLPGQVMIDFNEWAKGKALTKDVIIHTIPFKVSESSQYCYVAIAVYYPEGSQFDTE